jgi:ubiquinone/menaquinone biosynthesis C-methylase UbiE
MRKKHFDIICEKKYYNKAPSKLFVTPDHLVENMMRLTTGFSDWQKLFEQKVVLEVGAGECSYLRFFHKNTSANLFIMQDIFAERMLIAKEYGEYNRVKFIASDVRYLPLYDGSIDMCMAFGLLHHIPDLAYALNEIYRVLRRGGIFIFRDPCADNLLVWLKYRFGHKSDNEFPLFRRQIKMALEKAGFRIIGLHRFWLRFPKLPPGPWSVNIGGIVEKV